MTCRLQKTDSVVCMHRVGIRVVYYSPELDMRFIKDKGWSPIDCTRNWTKVKDTNHIIEFGGRV